MLSTYIFTSFSVTQCASPLPVWWPWWTRRKRKTWGNSTAPRNTAPRTCVPRRRERCVGSCLLTRKVWKRWSNSAKRDCTLSVATLSKNKSAVWNKVKKVGIWLLNDLCECLSVPFDCVCVLGHCTLCVPLCQCVHHCMFVCVPLCVAWHVPYYLLLSFSVTVTFVVFTPSQRCEQPLQSTEITCPQVVSSPGMHFWSFSFLWY